MSLLVNMRYMNPYEVHKLLINHYILKRSGDTSTFKRDTSKDKTDYDVLKDHHKFIWNDESPDSWEAQFAKKYYDKLFKEYCIGDLTLYKENKIALRWRTEQEVVTGKGQFICANKRCCEKDHLKTWEVNFAYKEGDEKKNALVKIRLCPACSEKLNFKSKKREIKRIDLKKKHKSKTKKATEMKNKKRTKNAKESSESESDKEMETNEKMTKDVDESPWEKQKIVESKSREEEMEEYLQDLLL